MRTAPRTIAIKNIFQWTPIPGLFACRDSTSRVPVLSLVGRAYGLDTDIGGARDSVWLSPPFSALCGKHFGRTLRYLRGSAKTPDLASFPRVSGGFGRASKYAAMSPPAGGRGSCRAAWDPGSAGASPSQSPTATVDLHPRSVALGNAPGDLICLRFVRSWPQWSGCVLPS